MTGDLFALLRSDPKLAQWLDGLERADAPDTPIALPPAADLAEVLLDLAVPHEDINDLVSLCARAPGDPGLRRLLELCARALIRDVGRIGRPFELPPLPAESGIAGRLVYVLVFLAALPRTRAYHREHGIPGDVARRTLADLGRNMAAYRMRHGVGGMIAPFWLRNHFRGELYQLGRLQFQRARLGNRTGSAVAAAGLPLGPGDPVLEIHIPGMRGPLTPESCDRSLALARDFFPEHFPEERYRVAAIHSWAPTPSCAPTFPPTRTWSASRTASARATRWPSRMTPARPPSSSPIPISRSTRSPAAPRSSGRSSTTCARAATGTAAAGGSNCRSPPAIDP